MICFMQKKVLTLRAVIFDMDGVITNTMPDHFHAWREVLAQEGVRVSHFDIYSREGQRGINSVHELFAEKNKPVTQPQAAHLLRKKEELFKRIVRQRFILGTRRLLQDLRRADLELALVTGTSRHELQQILPARLQKLFKVIITGSDVKNGKPHPEPYCTALKKLKIKPRQAVVIENAPFGIASAKAAGLRCIALATSLPPRYLQKADWVYPSVKTMTRQIHFQAAVS